MQGEDPNKVKVAEKAIETSKSQLYYTPILGAFAIFNDPKIAKEAQAEFEQKETVRLQTRPPHVEVERRRARVRGPLAPPSEINY